MPFVTRKSLLTLGVLSGVGAAALAGFIWSGIYNIGADDVHTRPVYSLLQTMRMRSIDRYASDVKVPDLTDAALIRQGAGNYDSMCTGCHLAPGMEGTELSRGLYPAPPNLATAATGNPAHHFWVIKHGIKASGMPAWGKSMDDQYIWGMVAFIQQLPKLDADGYRAMVASSGGHSHGGGETADHHDDAMPAHADGEAAEAAPHEHAPGTPPHDDAPAAPKAAPHEHAPGTPPHDDAPAAPKAAPHAHAPGTPPHDDAPAAPKMQAHRHADGTVESHPVPEAAAPADDEPAAEEHTDHQH